VTVKSDQGLGSDARREADQSAKGLTRGVDLRPRSGRARLRLGYPYWILGVLVLFFGTHLASGFYVVGADERAVVRRFGAVEAEVGPGMHYRLPWPVDRVDVVKTTSVMKVGVGFAIPAGDSSAPSGMELVTGDTNFFNAALVLQYVIRDPADNGARRVNASLYRSMMWLPPHAHQSMSVTFTQWPLPHTRT